VIVVVVVIVVVIGIIVAEVIAVETEFNSFTSTSMELIYTSEYRILCGSCSDADPRTSSYPEPNHLVDVRVFEG
jgi:hypothetical protein